MQWVSCKNCNRTIHRSEQAWCAENDCDVLGCVHCLEVCHECELRHCVEHFDAEYICTECLVARDEDSRVTVVEPSISVTD